MLKTYSTKSVLLLGAVMALSVFPMPSMASAASWIGSGGIHSNNIGFSSFGLLASQSACGAVTFGTTRHSGAVLTITTATFNRCAGTSGITSGCTVTATGTGFPWRATAVSTTDIRIDGFHADVRVETTPGSGLPPCGDFFNGVDLTWTGTLGLGVGTQTVWDPLGKRLTFNNTTGLAWHIAAASLNGIPTIVNGNLVATGTLNLVD